MNAKEARRLANKESGKTENIAKEYDDIITQISQKAREGEYELFFEYGYYGDELVGWKGTEIYRENYTKLAEAGYCIAKWKNGIMIQW